MADFQISGRRDRSVAHWVLTSRIPKAVPLLSSCTTNKVIVIPTVMEDDDPWFWDVDRVIRELCTDQRSWVPKTASPRIPDPVLLEKILREQEIDGSTLLTEIDETDLKDEFGLKIRGPRATIKHAIGELRYKSPQYQAWKTRHLEKPLTSVSIYSPISVGSNIGRDSEMLHFSTSGPSSHHLRATLAREENEGSPLTRFDDSATQDQAAEDFILRRESWVADTPGNKRRKLDLPNTQTNVSSQDNIGVDFVINGSEYVSSEELPAQEPQALVEVAGIIPAVPAINEHLLSETPAPEKKRRRIAPTLVTSIIVTGRDRDIPTEADTIQTYNPQNIEPGVTYNGNDGKRRLMPIPQSDPNPELTRAYQIQLLCKLSSNSCPLKEADQHASDPAGHILRATGEGKPADQTESRAAGYLGKKKFPVDDIFYASTMIGKELPSGTDDESVELVAREDISSGRRLYMHKVMKKYLLSKPQIIHRDGKSVKAIIPYSKYLIPMHRSPSFTLFRSNNNRKVCVTREALCKWPELDSTTKSKLPYEDDERRALFDLPDNLRLGGPSSYDDWDPDLLNKYRYIDGGDTVLPLYGESDEDNAYDEETWEEIQKECGTLERPLLPLRKRHLIPEEIDIAMDEGIDQIVSKWRKEKLPKLQAKAWKVWKRSRIDGNKRQQIREFQQHLDRINNERIVSLRKEICEEVWTSKKQVHKQTRIMEQSIFDREDLVWRISILEQRNEPEKPLSLDLPHLKEERSRRYRGSPLDGDDESIGTESQLSSSDDGLEDFIVDDDIDAKSDEMELRHMDDEAEDVTTTEASGSSDSEIDDAAGIKEAESVSRNEAKPIVERKLSSEGDDPQQNAFRTGDRAQAQLHPDSDSSQSSQESQLTDIHMPGHPPARLQPQNPRANQGTIHDVIVITSDSSAAEGIINSTTPEKSKCKTEAVLKREETSASEKSVIELDTEDSTFTGKPPPFEDTNQISRYMTHWEGIQDRDRLLIAIIHKKLDEKIRASLWDLLSTFSNEKLWEYTVQVLHTFRDFEDKVKGMDQKTYLSLTKTIQLFEMYVNCRYLKRRKPLSPITVKNLEDSGLLFPAFCKICHQTLKAKSLKTAPHGNGTNVDTEDFLEPRSTTQRRSRELNSSASEVDENQTPHKVRKRKVFENAYARSLREQDQGRLREQERRRQVLRQRLAKSGTSVSADRARIIINDGKFEHQGFVYINEEIGKQIKDHQIDGVRFMWSQIVANEGAMQGCLLAHTMGLGKTMQVITLLVAIAEAASSKDESVFSQIPLSLRFMRTLILCPPGLIDNWMDELLTWAPDRVLGYLRKVDSAMKEVDTRLAIIDSWDQDGGVLIIGYEMFRSLIQNKETKKRGQLLDEEEHNKIKKQLLEGPNIIIADEAHKMKNANATVTSAAMRFKSRSRIALTGSPLANNVEEYHTMIEWVAPNYLGPATEFRAKYVEPIQAGLWNDSTSYERRRSLKMLGVLKEDLSPKVHRADMSVLRNDLTKLEFIITVPLTDLQIKAYSLYVRSMLGRASNELIKDGKVQQTTLWHWLSVLSLLCNHPECFRTKLVERKEAAKKGLEAKSKKSINSNMDAASEDEYIVDSTPIWKIGVSEDLIKQEMELFNSFGSPISAFENSNKVKILLQILDASKAAGDKVLIFSQSIPTLNYLEMVCQRTNRDYSRLDGNTKMGERQSLTKKFNTGKTELYLISTTAGGLGLNLYGANRVIIFDFKFNPINEEQAVGRVYRIGQQKPVFVYRFVAGGTFEDKMQNKAVFKMQLASRVVDKKNPLAWAKKDAGEFLFEPSFVEQQNLSGFRGMDPKVLDPILDRQASDSSIRAIVMTDTFERHDNDELTAEEKKEVEQLLSDEQLKRSNPQMYTAERLRRQQELLKAKYQEGVTQPGSSSTAIHPQALTPSKLGSVNRSINGAILPPKRPQVPPTPIRPSVGGALLPGHPATPVSSGLPNSAPIVGANTNIVGVTSTIRPPLGINKNHSSDSATPSVENGQAILEGKSSSQATHSTSQHSAIPASGPSRGYLMGKGVLEGGIIQHIIPTKTEEDGSARTPRSSNSLHTLPASINPPPAKQTPEQQLRAAVKEACRSCGSLHEIDSEASGQIIGDITESLRKAIETRMKNASLTSQRLREITQKLRQEPNLINHVLSGDTDYLAALGLSEVDFNGSASISNAASSLKPSSTPSLQPISRTPNNGLPATGLLSTNAITKTGLQTTSNTPYPSRGAVHSGLKTLNMHLRKQEEFIQDIRTALHTAFSSVVETRGKPLGMYTSVQEAAEKVAREIVKALVNGAEDTILLDAVESTLEFIRKGGSCWELTQSEMNFKEFAQKMIRKVLSDHQISTMDGSTDKRKSHSPIPAESSVRSLRTPLPKRPRDSRGPYRSPQAKVDLEYLPKAAARLKTYMPEEKDPSKLGASPHQSKLAQLPSWAIDEIEKAKIGGPSERHRGSRAPSQSQPPSAP